jgi:LysR family hydrogen peroxide-inducible transcriptional activator
MKLMSVVGLSLRDLEYAHTVANEGHFGRAAEICGVSQPAISKQIQKLEARLGIVIFERQGKRIFVTEYGKIFLRKAEIILAEARELLAISSSLSPALEGDLRLGVIPTLGPYLMPLVLKAIKLTYPKLRLSLYEHPTEMLESLLTERKIDAIILATEPTSQAFNTAKLFFEPFIYASPTGFDLTTGSEVNWPPDPHSQLVLLSREHCVRDQTMALCDLIDEPGQRVASSLEMLRQMVALGNGAALLPALSISGPDPFGGLVTLHPIRDKRFGRQVRLIWRKSDPRAEHIDRFGTFLAKQMAAPQMKKRLKL